MNEKKAFSIVYVFVNNTKNKYFDMFFISYASLRLYMPDINVLVLTDFAGLSFLKESFKELFVNKCTEVKAVDIPTKYNQTEKSRFLKTNLCNFVREDFVYIDCDTIITSNFQDYIIVNNLSMVLDDHSELSKNSPIKLRAKNRNLNIDKCKQYFNSGVIIAKNNSDTKSFFEKWFKNWEETHTKDMPQDQFSLNYVNLELNFISELNGEWNCQTASKSISCINYLSEAKIIHYFNTQANGNYILNDEKALHEIAMSSDLPNVILKAKKLFRPTYIISHNSSEGFLIKTKHFSLLKISYTKCKTFFHFNEKILSLFKGNRKKMR